MVGKSQNATMAAECSVCDEPECSVCYEPFDNFNHERTTLAGCGHASTCWLCSQRVEICPVCREPIGADTDRVKYKPTLTKEEARERLRARLQEDLKEAQDDLRPFQSEFWVDVSKVSTASAKICREELEKGRHKLAGELRSLKADIIETREKEPRNMKQKNREMWKEIKELKVAIKEEMAKNKTLEDCVARRHRRLDARTSRRPAPRPYASGGVSKSHAAARATGSTKRTVEKIRSATAVGNTERRGRGRVKIRGSFVPKVDSHFVTGK